MGTGDFRWVQRIAVPAPDHCLRAAFQFSAAADAVEGGSGFLDDHCPEHAVHLMGVGKQMIMEKDGPQPGVGKEAFDQRLISSCTRNVAPAV